MPNPPKQFFNIKVQFQETIVRDPKLLKMCSGAVQEATLSEHLLEYVWMHFIGNVVCCGTSSNQVGSRSYALHQKSLET